MTIPEGEHVEEVSLMDFDPRQGGSGHGGEVYDEDDDHDHPGASRVQCAHQ